MIKWDKKSIIEFVNETDKYKFVEFIIFDGIKSIIKVKCLNNKNHDEFECKFSSLKNNESRNRGSCCIECKKEKLSSKNRLDFNIVKERIEVDGYKLISKEYINKNKKLKIQCPKCNVIFDMSYNNFYNHKQRCPKCSKIDVNLKQRLTYDYVKHEIEKTNEYILLSKVYNSCWDKLDIKCIKHNLVFKKDYHSFQQGKKCPKCGSENRTEKQKLDYEYIKNFISSQGDTLLDEEYINNRTELKIQCSNGHIFYSTFYAYTQGKRCAICREKITSNGELKIENALAKYNIKYIPQYKFKDCKFKKVLPFDFYLPSLNICIEYDGIQHYQIREHFGGYENFIDTKIRDTIKNIYCEENNIKLIRIPYWEFDNIEEIIKNLLNKYE